jgi:hypothetical protein
MDKGLGSIETGEKNIRKSLESSDNMSQADLIRLQQQTNQYAQLITMMTTILKNLSDSDKEVSRNC